MLMSVVSQYYGLARGADEGCGRREVGYVVFRLDKKLFGMLS